MLKKIKKFLKEEGQSLRFVLKLLLVSMGGASLITSFFMLFAGYGLLNILIINLSLLGICASIYVFVVLVIFFANKNDKFIDWMTK